eukprot:UN12211
MLHNHIHNIIVDIQVLVQTQRHLLSRATLYLRLLTTTIIHKINHIAMQKGSGDKHEIKIRMMKNLQLTTTKNQRPKEVTLKVVKMSNLNTHQGVIQIL